MKCSQYLYLGDRSKFLLQSASGTFIKNIEFQDCELYEHFNFKASRTGENQCIQFNRQFKKFFLGLYQSYIVFFEESKYEQTQSPLYYFDINMSYFRKCKPQQNTKQESNKGAIHLELLYEDVTYQFQFIYPNIDTYKQWVRAFEQHTIRLQQPKKYKIIRVLGEGSNAIVRLASKQNAISTKETNCKLSSFHVEDYMNNFQNEVGKQLHQIKNEQQQYVAIKQICKDSIKNSGQSIQQLRNEIQCQRKLISCGNILKLYKVYESQNNIYLFLEYQSGGTLSDTISKTKQILEKDLQVIMAQLLLAIDYMHEKSIMHRDLKLANILLTTNVPDSYDLRIADFGLACELRNDGRTLERCGTPTYIAPEILLGQDYNTKVDIFSLGSIMFNLISGRYLFSKDGNGHENIIYLNKMCDLTHISQYTQGVSDEARDLLFKLLEKNPNNRISPRDALMHSWFKADQEALEVAIQLNNQIKVQTLQRYTNITTTQLDQNNQDAHIKYLDRQQRGRLVEKKFSLQSSLSSCLSNNRSYSNLNRLQRNSSDKNIPILSYYDIITTNCNAQSKSPIQATDSMKAFTTLRKGSKYNLDFRFQKANDSGKALINNITSESQKQLQVRRKTTSLSNFKLLDQRFPNNQNQDQLTPKLKVSEYPIDSSYMVKFETALIEEVKFQKEKSLIRRSYINNNQEQLQINMRQLKSLKWQNNQFNNCQNNKVLSTFGRKHTSQKIKEEIASKSIKRLDNEIEFLVPNLSQIPSIPIFLNIQQSENVLSFSRSISHQDDKSSKSGSNSLHEQSVQQNELNSDSQQDSDNEQLIKPRKYQFRNSKSRRKSLVVPMTSL